MAWSIILFLSVCMYVFQMITFEILDTGSSFSHIWYISRETVMFVYEGHRSRSQEQKGMKSLFPEGKTFICKNSGL